MLQLCNRKIHGTLDNNGFASHSGISPGTCTVEYELEIDQHITQLRSAVATALQEITQIEKAEAARLGQTLAQSNLAEQSLIYTGAALTGAKNTMISLIELVGDVAMAAGKSLVMVKEQANEYLLDPLNAPKIFQQDSRTISSSNPTVDTKYPLAQKLSPL